MESENQKGQAIGKIDIPQVDAKNKAQEIIRTLTLLNTSVAYLDDPISKSNQLLSKIALQVQNIKHKNPFIEKIYVYLFSQEREQFYTELTEYSDELTLGVVKAKDLLGHITICVDQLSNLIFEISDERIRKDYQGIVSVNRLKIATIEQGISFAEKQINAVDKYRTVTLYHLSDAVQHHPNGPIDNAVDGYEELSVQFVSREQKIKHFNIQCMRICFAASLLSIINNLATNYYITWISTKYRDLVTYQEESGIDLNVPSERLFDAVQMLFICILLLAASPITFMLVKAIRNERTPVYAVLMLIFVVLGIVGFAVLGSDSSGSNVMQESYQVVNSISFFNLGEIFTNFMAFSAFLSIILLLAIRYLNKDFYKAKMLFNNLQTTSIPKKLPSK